MIITFLESLWARRVFAKLQWIELEEGMVDILRSDLSDSDKVRATKEILDAFTRRGISTLPIT